MFYCSNARTAQEEDTSNKRLYQAYSRDNLQKALHAVTMKNMSQREASKIFGVP